MKKLLVILAILLGLLVVAGIAVVYLADVKRRRPTSG